VLLVKSLMWGVSLGSGTSGGVLAPLLMMGGALGALESLFLPNQGQGFWQLISMGAILGGTMRSPLTGVIFSFELTNDYHAILPLLIACVCAHACTVLTLKRSILTEKISRRGHHLTREYVVDPLEALAVEDVMRTNITALPAETTMSELEHALNSNQAGRGQRLYPVIDAANSVLGVVTRGDLQKFRHELGDGHRNVRLSDILKSEPLVAHPDEPLRIVVNRMAASSVTRFPVVERGPENRLVGMIGLQDLLRARELSVEQELTRERVLRLRLLPRLRWHRN
jgi:CBS domain-containing protein